MVLRMARATNRPETAVYQFRKRVPRDVLALIGGPPIVKESLRTKDRDEAKRLFKEVEAKYQARWAQIRLCVQDLDDKQVAAFAGEVYRDLFGRIGNQRDHWVQHAWAGFKWGCDLLDKEEENTPFRAWTESLERFHVPAS